MGWTSEWLSRTLQRHPAVLRALIRLTEPVRPPGMMFGRAREVRDIFDRTHDFQVGFTIAPKTKTGPFLLSMDEGPRHTREKRALVRAIDMPFGRYFAPTAKTESDACARAVALRLQQSETVDLASEYAERVFIRTLAKYFGLPIDGWKSAHLAVPEGERTLARYVRYLGATIGSGSTPAPFGLEELALAIAEDFKSQLTAAIDAHARLEPQPETVLGYLFDPRPHPAELQVEQDAKYVELDGLTRSIAGLLSAGASFPKAVANVLHELSQRKLLEKLVDKANEPGLTDEAWTAHLEPYVLEALRFRPAFPLLVRYCPRAAALAGHEIAAGSTVGFSPLAAMFDPAHIDRPEEFIPGRPDDNYLIFGAGPRACIGKRMMLALFPPLLRALFAQVPAIASAEPGTFHYDGAALEHYWVTVKRSQAKLLPMQPSVEPVPAEQVPLAAAPRRHDPQPAADFLASPPITAKSASSDASDRESRPT